jgi:ferredoxin
MNLVSQKMGLHEWSYSNDYDAAGRQKMRHVELEARLKALTVEVEEGFDIMQTLKEVERCLNCDVQTHFTGPLCIECDACIDICPLSCLTIAPNGAEEDLRERLSAPALNLSQSIFVSEGLPQTGRLMVKDEDLCIHCGLCAERCPTAAWDMRAFDLQIPYAGLDAGAQHSDRRAVPVGTDV